MDKTQIKAKLDNCKTRLKLYYNAEKSILEGAQSYAVGSRHLTRADLSEIRKMINNLEADVEELESALAGYGRRKTMRVIPRDV